MICSIHIPKTAGTSFKQFLKRSLHNRVCFDYRDLRVPGKGVVLAIPEDTLCIHGHYKATKYARAFPEALTATWFRDPIQRLFSHFYYWKRAPDPANPACAAFQEAGFDPLAFIENPANQNIYDHYLDGKPVDEFDFIGLTSDTERSLLLFGKICGIEISGGLNDLRQNPSKNGTDYEVEASFRHYIEQLNSTDIDLYAAAEARFEALCAVHDV